MFGQPSHTIPTTAVVIATFLAGAAQAQVFEVIHPDVEKGEFELEVLTGVTLEDVDDDEEQSAYEFSIGYGVTSFWKPTVAVEFADIEGEGFEYVGFEWENVFLLPVSGSAGNVSLEALGFFAALEIPDDGGFDEGAVELGPLAEFHFGPVETVTNLFVEIPFADGEDEGLAYVVAAAVDVSDTTALGVEAFGEVENVFTSGTDSEVFVGPVAYFDFDLASGMAIEPRVAVLFGTESDQPDAVLSFNMEFKF
ncbi:MAG: hypothetical protein AAGF30_06210 [Pseudomonadota bacterium]